MKAGIDYIGVSVGALVFNAEGAVLLSQRGQKAKNEQGTWEFPGGSVDYGERLEDAVQREFREECGIEIELIEMLAVDSHILPNEGQHWVATTYLARHTSGVPVIKEPEKCSGLGWFRLDQLPSPLSVISQYNVRDYLAKYGTNPPKP